MRVVVVVLGGWWWVGWWFWAGVGWVVVVVVGVACNCQRTHRNTQSARVGNSRRPVSTLPKCLGFLSSTAAIACHRCPHRVSCTCAGACSVFAFGTDVVCAHGRVPRCAWACALLCMRVYLVVHACDPSVTLAGPPQLAALLAEALLVQWSGEGQVVPTACRAPTTTGCPPLPVLPVPVLHVATAACTATHVTVVVPAGICPCSFSARTCNHTGPAGLGIWPACALVYMYCRHLLRCHPS